MGFAPTGQKNALKRVGVCKLPLVRVACDDQGAACSGTGSKLVMTWHPINYMNNLYRVKTYCKLQIFKTNDKLFWWECVVLHLRTLYL